MSHDDFFAELGIQRDEDAGNATDKLKSRRQRRMEKVERRQRKRRRHWLTSIVIVVTLVAVGVVGYKAIGIMRDASAQATHAEDYRGNGEGEVTVTIYEGKVKNRKERISNYLKDVNLYNEVKEDFKMSALKLSGGQKQRLCIARMLTTDPDILIFDEPCSSLDMENTLIIEKLIKRLSEKYTVILTTHNEEQAKRIADRTILIGK